jgi:hypothetical protein
MAATMRTTSHATSRPTSLPWLVKRGALALWHELPGSLAGGALALAATVPLVVAALVAAPGWLLAMASVPPSLALTGLARYAAAVVRGEGVHVRALGRLDPVLALVLAGALTVAGLGLKAGGTVAVAGAAIGAVALLVGPLALAYGAVRDRSGLSALRGGLILVAYRPSWALTLLALACIGGFAMVATVGALTVVVVPLVLAIGCSIVTDILTDIDAIQKINAPRDRR